MISFLVDKLHDAHFMTMLLAAIAAGAAQFGVIQAAAAPLQIELNPIGVRDAAEVERGIATLADGANSGLIVTANARVTGPEYKQYITDHWEEPYRTARIYDLLHDKQDLRPEDMLRVEADTYSYPHVFIAQQLVAASKVAQPKDERTRKLIAQAKDWNGMADANSPVVSFLDVTMRRALHLVLQPQLGNDTDSYQWRSVAFLQRVLTERPGRWLPAEYKSYDDLLVVAADRVDDVVAASVAAGVPAWVAGRVVEGERGVDLVGSFLWEGPASA